MRSENLDPAITASGRVRLGRRRGRIVVAAVGIAASGGFLLMSAASASASTITETFGGHGPTGPLELQVSESITQPASVSPGQTMTISVPSSSQVVPTKNIVPVNYISDLQTLIPVPHNATFAGNIVAGNWSFTPAGGGTATTGPLTVTECTSASSSCTATAPDGSTFLGPGTSTPYIEATTGSAQFAAGGKLTLPAWSFDVTAASTGTIQSTVSEFDTNANVNLGTALHPANVDVSVYGYPAAAVTGCLTAGGTCTQAAYKFQPIATTTIGSAGSTTSTTRGSTTSTTRGSTATTRGTTTTTTAAHSSGGTTPTTVAASSGGTTPTTAAATVAAGGSTPTTTPPSGSLAYTGPPKMVWLLGLLGLVLLDIGYLALSSTWKGRRARNSSAG